jgi:hypothetical protein
MRLELTVLAYIMALSLLAAMAFGLTPAWQASKANLSGMIGGGAGATPTQSRQRLKDVLVVAEVAMCCVLLVCAGLSVRSLQRAGEIDPGFETQQMLTVGVDPQTGGFDAQTGLALFGQAKQ